MMHTSARTVNRCYTKRFRTHSTRRDRSDRCRSMAQAYSASLKASPHDLAKRFVVVFIISFPPRNEAQATAASDPTGNRMALALRFSEL